MRLHRKLHSYSKRELASEMFWTTVLWTTHNTAIYFPPLFLEYIFTDGSAHIAQFLFRFESPAHGTPEGSETLVLCSHFKHTCFQLNFQFGKKSVFGQKHPLLGNKTFLDATLFFNIGFNHWWEREWGEIHARAHPLTHTQTCSPTSIEENKKATLHATIVHNTSENIFCLFFVS